MNALLTSKVVLLCCLIVCLIVPCNTNAQFGIINTVAGNGVAAFGGDGSAAVSASLNTPLGVWVDAAGNIYIADQGNNRIRKVTAATGIISTIAGNGVAGFSGDGGPALTAGLNEPAGICFDGAGNLYIGDWANHRVRMVTPGGIISTVAGTGTAGFSGDGGLATLAGLDHPYGVWVDAAGNLYITDQGNLRVRVVNGATGIISTFAGTGTSGFCCDGSPAVSASFTTPAGICKNAAGEIFFSTQGGDARVRNVNTAGIISTEMGDGTASYSGDCGPATAAEIEWPQGLAIDGAGNVYLATSSDYRIRMVNASTNIIQTVAGNGSTTYSGDGGPALSAGMNPYGVFIDGVGNIYIAGDNRIREVTVAANTDSVFFCEGSSAVLGGTSSFVDSFKWSTGATTSSITVSTSGTYWVREVVCASSRTDTFFVNAIITNVDLGPDTTICTGSPITLSSSDTYFSPVYLWSTGSAASSISVSAAGTYWLKVTDHGCSGTDTVTVGIRPTPAVDLGPDTAACAGNFVVLRSSDTYTGPVYLWSTGSAAPSINVSATGAYWLDVTVNGCTGSDTVNFTSKPIPIVALGNDTTICSGVALTLQSSIPYIGASYLWSTAAIAPAISVATAGAYWLDVTIRGCTGSDTIHVSVQPSPAAPIAGSNSPLCAGNTLLLTATDATAGVTYNWTGPLTYVSTLQNPAIPLATTAETGFYAVTATSGACTATTTEYIRVNATPPAPVLGSNSPVCSGNGLDLTATDTAGATFYWTGPNSFISVLQNPVFAPAITAATGIYTVTATLNGCPSAPSVLVAVVDSTPATPVISNNSPGMPAICEGDTLKFFTAEPTAGAGYSWAGPNSFFSIVPDPVITPVNTAATGTYTLTVSLALCSSSAVTTVSITPTPSITATNNGPICTGTSDTLFLQAASDPGATFSWTGPYVLRSAAQSPFRTPVIAEYGGVYTVSAILNGCYATINDTVVVRQTPGPPMVSWLTFCQYYDAPRLQAMGDSVLWYASSVAAGAGSLTGPVPSTSAPGNMFYYSSQTTSGCTSAIDSTQVTILPKPVVTAPGDTTLCPGDSIILSAVNADPGAIFSWSPSLYLGGTSGRVTTSSPETSVTYSVIATNQYGCTDTGKVSISVYPAAVIALGDSVTIYSGQSYQVSTQSNCVSFIWYPPAGLNDAFIANPIASPAINTKYIVNASTQDGCTAADSINVYVSNSAALALPNAFTPGTGANGVFKIINEGISKLNYFRIYDRWGVKVFETTNAETGWDGAYNGTPQPQGVYVYELSASGSDGSAFVKQGNITLLR